MSASKNTVKFEVFEGRVVVATLMSHGRKFVGAAKCSPDDTFDLEVGKKIAEARARKKVAQADLRFWKERREEAIFLDKMGHAAIEHSMALGPVATAQIEYNQRFIQEVNRFLYPNKAQ